MFEPEYNNNLAYQEKTTEKQNIPKHVLPHNESTAPPF